MAEELYDPLVKRSIDHKLKFDQIIFVVVRQKSADTQMHKISYLSTFRPALAGLVCSPVTGSNSPKCFPCLSYISTVPCWLSHSKIRPLLSFQRLRAAPPPWTLVLD